MKRTEREILFQTKLWEVLKKICSRGPIGGLSLRVTLALPLDGRSPDIVVIKEPEGIPILIIETKRKLESESDAPYNPFDPSAIGQVLSYAALAKENFKLPATPLFATSNPDILVLFGPIEKPWEYLDMEAFYKRDYKRVIKSGAYISLVKEHYIFHERNPLREEVAFKVLDTAVKLWLREVDILSVKREIGFWLIDQLRYFVDYMDSYYVRDPLKISLQRNQEFYSKLDNYARQIGYSNGLVDIVGPDLNNMERLSRIMVYVLMNKIIFYKVLENYYNLPKLEPFAHLVNSTSEYLNKLNKFFEEAVKVSGNFEQIFYTGLYDNIVVEDDVYARLQIDELIKTLSEINLQEFGDVIGHVYEDLIPEEERHMLGQFYTPRPIAELITKWCIRSGDDVVLGPGCGSGTFEVEAYWRLVESKTGRHTIPSRDVHTKVLRQIFALDINPFPVQLTTMNLAMKNVLAPVTDLNIIECDFFKIGLDTIYTPENHNKRKVIFPKEGFDVIIGNPPYTRWDEISDTTKEFILNRLGELIRKYNLLPSGGVKAAQNPGIYTFWIMHSYSFLREGGRLGMIISDSWLQTDYGIEFGRYLLENFKVKALIDVCIRVFTKPLIGTCILLLEKPRKGEDIYNNNVVFIYLDIPEGKSIKVDEILYAIANPEDAKSKFWIKTFRQGDLPKDTKWINFLFNPNEILSKLMEKTILVQEIFRVSKGTTKWHVLTSAGTGADRFFFIPFKVVERYSLYNYVFPAIASSKYVIYFSFDHKDWIPLKSLGKRAYAFICHIPKEELPATCLKYINWGETECRSSERRGRGNICSQTIASRTRAKDTKNFYGWYDLGGVINAPILAVYQSRYKTRFIWNKLNAVTYHAMIAFIPKDGVKLTDTQIKALLAYLNSSFTQLYIESKGRTTGAVGPIGLEVKHAEEMPIIDINKLNEGDLRELADLFDKLDSMARKLCGADKRKNIMKLWDTIITEIDYKIADILGLPRELADGARTLAKMMMERRLQRAQEARPQAIRGEEEFRLLKPPIAKGKRRQKMKEDQSQSRLNGF